MSEKEDREPIIREKAKRGILLDGSGLLRSPASDSEGIVMAMFVHLAPESRTALIRRTGIGRLRRPSGDFPGGVFAVPVTRNFYLSHQWLRELKRRNGGPIAGVYFRILDTEQVWVGHYGQAHRWMDAAEAVAIFMAADSREGWEVIVPRRIEAAEIHRVRRLPQVLGWRYWPSAHGRRPCGCEFCQRGLYGAKRLREQYNQS
jgi:hypothetical protein